MKRVTADYLASAERSLAKARIVLGVDLADEAGRLAYYAMFHAAQALIFERTDRVAKTHKGVNRLFHRLALKEASLDPKLPPDLSNAYQLKQSADYETGDAVPVAREEAVDALAAAERFVSQVRQLLTFHAKP
jgi:uncharacterized protein (UPF0332 family)